MAVSGYWNVQFPRRKRAAKLQRWQILHLINFLVQFDKSPWIHPKEQVYMFSEWAGCHFLFVGYFDFIFHLSYCRYAEPTSNYSGVWWIPWPLMSGQLMSQPAKGLLRLYWIKKQVSSGGQYWLSWILAVACQSRILCLFHHTYFHDYKWDCERVWMEMRQVYKDGLLVAACVTTVFKLQNWCEQFSCQVFIKWV